MLQNQTHPMIRSTDSLTISVHDSSYFGKAFEKKPVKDQVSIVDQNLNSQIESKDKLNAFAVLMTKIANSISNGFNEFVEYFSMRFGALGEQTAKQKKEMVDLLVMRIKPQNLNQGVTDNRPVTDLEIKLIKYYLDPNLGKLEKKEQQLLKKAVGKATTANAGFRKRFDNITLDEKLADHFTKGMRKIAKEDLKKDDSKTKVEVEIKIVENKAKLTENTSKGTVLSQSDFMEVSWQPDSKEQERWARNLLDRLGQELVKDGVSIQTETVSQGVQTDPAEQVKIEARLKEEYAAGYQKGLDQGRSEYEQKRQQELDGFQSEKKKYDEDDIRGQNCLLIKEELQQQKELNQRQKDVILVLNKHQNELRQKEESLNKTNEKLFNDNLTLNRSYDDLADKFRVLSEDSFKNNKNFEDLKSKYDNLNTRNQELSSQYQNLQNRHGKEIVLTEHLTKQSMKKSTENQKRELLNKFEDEKNALIENYKNELKAKKKFAKTFKNELNIQKETNKTLVEQNHSLYQQLQELQNGRQSAYRIGMDYQYQKENRIDQRPDQRQESSELRKEIERMIVSHTWDFEELTEKMQDLVKSHSGMNELNPVLKELAAISTSNDNILDEMGRNTAGVLLDVLTADQDPGPVQNQESIDGKSINWVNGNDSNQNRNEVPQQNSPRPKMDNGNKIPVTRLLNDAHMNSGDITEVIKVYETYKFWGDKNPVLLKLQQLESESIRPEIRSMAKKALDEIDRRSAPQGNEILQNQYDDFQWYRETVESLNQCDNENDLRSILTLLMNIAFIKKTPLMKEHKEGGAQLVAKLILEQVSSGAIEVKNRSLTKYLINDICNNYLMANLERIQNRSDDNQSSIKDLRKMSKFIMENAVSGMQKVEVEGLIDIYRSLLRNDEVEYLLNCWESGRQKYLG